MPTALLLLIFAPILPEENLTEHTLKAVAGTPAAKADLSQFRFLQGSWAGTGFSAQCDEMWSAPGGDCMLGTFRMTKEDQLTFSEFCMIQRDSHGRVVLRLKHFDPDFSGWEEKDKFVSFPLIKVEQDSAYFAGLTYALQPDGSLTVWVALEQQDGGFKEEVLQLRPVD